MHPKADVTACISTKDRYFSTLPLAISAILTQTVKPSRFILFDDGEQRDLRGVTPYSGFFKMFDHYGIAWEVVFGGRVGQVANHQKALEMAKTEFVWRLDDDNLPEPDCLEKLIFHLKDPKVGAAGGLVLFTAGITPRGPQHSGKIEEIFSPFGNLQWHTWDGPPEEVDHLYSTFLYRVSAGKAAGGYPKDLSPIGHHEETTFTHNILRAGYKLLVDPKALTWHLRDDSGGIRSFKDPNLWARDSEIFKKRLRDWGVTPKKYAIAVLNNGLGDHIVFRQLLVEFGKKHEGERIVIAVCYPEVFLGIPDLTVISVADAEAALGALDKYNVYKWADEHKPKTLQDAFRGLYEIPKP